MTTPVIKWVLHIKADGIRKLLESDPQSFLLQMFEVKERMWTVQLFSETIETAVQTIPLNCKMCRNLPTPGEYLIQYLSSLLPMQNTCVRCRGTWSIHCWSIDPTRRSVPQTIFCLSQKFSRGPTLRRLYPAWLYNKELPMHSYGQFTTYKIFYYVWTFFWQFVMLKGSVSRDLRYKSLPGIKIFDY